MALPFTAVNEVTGMLCLTLAIAAAFMPFGFAFGQAVARRRCLPIAPMHRAS